MTPLPPCPLCRAAGRREIATQRLLDPATAGGGDALTERTVGYVACGACDTVSMHPLPDQATLDGYYGGAPLETGEPGQSKTMAALADARLAVLRRVTGLRGGCALEIGAGPGRLLDGLRRDLGMRVLGLEPSSGFPGRDDILRLTLETFVPAAAGWPETSDLVVCCNVLEHVADAGAFLDGLCARVAAGGWLLLEVPSGERLARGEPCVYGQNIYPLHLHHFTGRGLAAQLAARGLTTVFLDDHAAGAYPSLMLAARRDGDDGPAQRFLDQLAHQQAASALAGERLRRLADEGRVLIWGAGVDAFEVLSLLPGGPPAQVDLYDRSPAKQGRRLAGLEILSDAGLTGRAYRTVLAGSRHRALGASILADARAVFPDAELDWLIPPTDGSKT